MNQAILDVERRNRERMREQLDKTLAEYIARNSRHLTDPPASGNGVTNRISRIEILIDGELYRTLHARTWGRGMAMDLADIFERHAGACSEWFITVFCPDSKGKGVSVWSHGSGAEGPYDRNDHR